MLTRLLPPLCAALALGAAGLAAYRWTQPPALERPLQEAARATLPPVPGPPQREQLDALARTPEGLAQLIGRYARSTDGAERERLLGAVARVGDGAAVGWLAEVAVGDERLGAHAAQALGSVEDRRAAPALATLLRQPGPVHLRANAARALARAGSGAQAPLLLARVADGREPLRVRQEAALALSRVGHAQQVAPLARLLSQLGPRRDPEAAQLRLSLVQALGGIGGGAARKALLRHARRPLAEAERAFVRQALVQR